LLLHPGADGCCIRGPVAAAVPPVCEEGVAGCQENKGKCSEYFLYAVMKHTIRLKLGVYFVKQ